MNIVTCISGLPLEGKSGELLEAFVTANNNPLLTAVLIVCVENESVRDIELNKIEQALSVLPQTQCDIQHVFNHEELKNCIYTHVSKSDCVVYIDMPEKIVQHFEIEVNQLVDMYPNIQCSNSLDIVYTRTRIPAGV